MTITSLKAKDKGREVRYTSTSGLTIMVGVLQDWKKTEGGSFLEVVPTAYEAPKKVKVASGLPVQMDPANVEFV